MDDDFSSEYYFNYFYLGGEKWLDGGIRHWLVGEAACLSLGLNPDEYLQKPNKQTVDRIRLVDGAIDSGELNLKNEKIAAKDFIKWAIDKESSEENQSFINQFELSSVLKEWYEKQPLLQKVTNQTNPSIKDKNVTMENQSQEVTDKATLIAQLNNQLQETVVTSKFPTVESYKHLFSNLPEIPPAPEVEEIDWTKLDRLNKNKSELLNIQLELARIELEKSKQKIEPDLKTENETLKAEIEDLKKQLTEQCKNEVSESERESFLKIVLGMAIEAYRYNPSSSKNTATGEKSGSIRADLQKAGLDTDNGTIKKYLDEAVERFKDRLSKP